MAEQDYAQDYLKAIMPPPISPADIEAKESKAVQEAKDVTAGMQKAAADTQAQRMALVKSMPRGAPPPQLNAIPPSPKMDYTDPIKAFQNPAVIIATLGSLFTRAPLTAAMNAGGAAMEAYHKGEMDTFELKQKEWKEKSEQAIAQNNVELEKYRAIMENARMATQEKLAEISAIGAGFNDQMMIGAAQKGDIKMAHDFFDQRVKAQDGLRGTLLSAEISEKTRLMTMAPDHVAMNKFMGEHPNATSEEIKDFVQSLRTYGSSLDDSTLDYMAQQLVDGNTTVLTNLGRGVQGSGNVVAVRKRATELAREQGKSPEEVNSNIASFMGMKRGESALGQREAQITSAITTAQMTIPRVLETSAKVDRTEYPDINKVILAVKQGTGNEDVVRFHIAIQTLVNNYARALGAGSTVLTDTARKEAMDMISSAWSKGQIQAATDQMQKELASELEGAKAAHGEFSKGYAKPKGNAPAAPANTGEWKIEKLN